MTKDAFPCPEKNPKDALTDHGGQVFTFAQKHQCSVNSILDFSANINPNQPKIDWKQLVEQAQYELMHYPPEVNPQADSPLKPVIATTFQLEHTQILLGNGISEMIHQLFTHLKPKCTWLFTPIYSEYPKAAKSSGCQVIRELCHSATEILNPDNLGRYFRGLNTNDFIVLVNPSTPQGEWLSPKIIRPLLEIAKQKQAWVLVDESFLPFVSLQKPESVRQWLSEFPQLIVLQSFTKFYSCPGIRIGAIFSNAKHLIKDLPWIWTLSTLDRLWLMQALQDANHEKITQDWLKIERPNFVKALEQLSIVKQVLPGRLNFVQVEFQLPVNNLQAFLEHPENSTTPFILIRALANYNTQNWARIALKSPKDNQVLLQRLAQMDNTPLPSSTHNIKGKF